MSNLIRTQVMLPADLLSELRALAEQKGWSVSEVVRRAARTFVVKKKAQPNEGELLMQEAKWAEKHAITGPADASTNDEYLYGKDAL